MANRYEERWLATAPLLALVDRMRNIQGLAIRNEFGDGAGGVFFKLSNGINATSWGEDVSVHMYIHDAQQTAVEIESQNSNPVQIGDFGKNRRNVEIVKNHLFAGLMVRSLA